MRRSLHSDGPGLVVSCPARCSSPRQTVWARDYRARSSVFLFIRLVAHSLGGGGGGGGGESH